MTTIKYDVKLIDSDGSVCLETKETFERYNIPDVIKYKHMYFSYHSILEKQLTYKKTEVHWINHG
jgi:hypothetical protein